MILPSTSEICHQHNDVANITVTETVDRNLLKTERSKEKIIFIENVYFKAEISVRIDTQ